MIHLTSDDIYDLYMHVRPAGLTECPARPCDVCANEDLCDALISAKQEPSIGTPEADLYRACTHYREHTDAVCDTYTCPNCPNYSWCTIIRGIAIEGVKIDEC